jgi:Cof subfamily protein (haloacid dehalogenase superfamily)
MFTHLLHKKTNQLFVSDLDGTLIDDTAQLSAQTAHKLKRYICAGLMFTIATARSYLSVKDIFKNIYFRLPIIEQNGALVTDFCTGERLFVNAMPFDYAIQVVTHMLKKRCCFFISIYQNKKEKWLYHQLTTTDIKFFIGNNDHLSNLCHPLDLSKILACKILNIFCLTSSTDIKNSLQSYKKNKLKNIDIFSFKHYKNQNNYWLCFHHKDATKGNAVKQILKTLNPEPTEIYVFGNEKNDISMFKEKKFIACVVDNSGGTIRQYAQYVIPIAQQNGVIGFIENQWSLRYLCH